MVNRSGENMPLTCEIACPRWDSNPHTFRYCILSAARLPFRHSGQSKVNGHRYKDHALVHESLPIKCAKLLYMQIGYFGNRSAAGVNIAEFRPTLQLQGARV